MDTLAISAANLNTIEKNLNAVADGLTGVVSNVSNVTDQVNKVESQVNTLNNEVKNLVKEIRETTIITNARQSIMYNNEQIDKKFSYYDNVRRTTESLLDAITSSSISRQSLYSLNQNILLNNPNYWLSNAVAAISYWILNDRANCEKEVANALKKDAHKASLFFAFTNIKLKRLEAALNWLKKYLSFQNPLELDKDFITVLDMMSSGLLGAEARAVIQSKLTDWYETLKNNPEVIRRQETIWNEYISEQEERDIYMPYLELHTKDIPILKHNLATTSSYHNVLNNLQKIMTTTTQSKTIDQLLANLIYDYETKEKQFQLDNLRNKLIIECNGDTETANRLYKKQELLYHDKVDILTILSNIVIYDTEYKTLDNTKKIALSLIKDFIISSYINRNKTINNKDIDIAIDGYLTTINKDKAIATYHQEISEFTEKLLPSEDKDIIIILIILNILGIIGIFITLENRLLSSLIIAIVIIGDIFLSLKMSRRNRLRENAKKKLEDNIANTLETVLAEKTDYENILKADNEEYINLINYLNTLNITNYLKNADERNIKIGD